MRDVLRLFDALAVLLDVLGIITARCFCSSAAPVCGLILSGLIRIIYLQLYVCAALCGDCARAPPPRRHYGRHDLTLDSALHTTSTVHGTVHSAHPTPPSPQPHDHVLLKNDIYKLRV